MAAPMGVTARRHIDALGAVGASPIARALSRDRQLWPGREPRVRLFEIGLAVPARHAARCGRRRLVWFVRALRGWIPIYEMNGWRTHVSNMSRTLANIITTWRSFRLTIGLENAIPNSR